MPHTPASRRTTQHTTTNSSSSLSNSSLSRREARRHRQQSRSQGKSQPQQSLRAKEHQRKVLWAGGAITLLAMATILPTQVASQAIADNKCERVIKSGAEVSRSQLSSLLSIPEGSTKQSLQQVIADPYCALPALSLSASPQASAQAGDIQKENITSATEESSQGNLVQYVLERDAYPLAFDPEAWLVVTYHSGEYQGYDFVFKP